MSHASKYLICFPSERANHAPSGLPLSVRNFLRPLAAVLTVLIAGCAAAPESRDASSHFHPAALVSSDRLIVSGERIGPLRLDGKIDEVVKLFGPGTVRERSYGTPELFVLQTWDAIGLWVQFDSMTGNIVWISVDTSGSKPWAEYSTPDGIRLGTRQQDIVSVMGTPERAVAEGGATSLYYDRRGIRFTLADTGPLAGKVGAMRIVWPSVPRGDTLVVPGKRISIIDVGAPVDRVLAILGGGYHRGEKSPGFHVYYWPHLGLSFVEQLGRVISVRAGSEIPADAPGLRYSTMDGLGRDSTVSQIRKVFGEPSKAEPSTGSRFWIYRSSGIAFELDNQQKVRLVDVFPPEKQ
jgi:hypothetical protein